ncbi:class I SAM-dependent methyltransferase [Cohnella abietis]|uniref:SAM-dependent methyltransferase n=1 Tax=Cohnella abietis TaxID=2507935 RepID=A0A3T1D2C9_9BACL|nr:class I SAM-dependent methyltransferase [Cohnella abietis]BBI32256.1 SAM-dependent methyltransferase [Cohnella abietis]
MVDANGKQKVHWNADGYDESMSFVSEYGEGIMKMLNPQRGEAIVDFGCGTGDLAAQIAAEGAKVNGIDISPEMIEKARNKYPHLSFHCTDGMRWVPEQTYDAVFSNAALHWMKDEKAAVSSMTAALRSGGRLIAEFGGHRNIEAIISAVKETLINHNREDAFLMPWYFPTIGQYSSLLELFGMEVRSAQLFDRPTRLENGEKGMQVWLEMFGSAMFPQATVAESEDWIAEAVERLKEKQYAQGTWIADYRRIRISAIKL